MNEIIAARDHLHALLTAAVPAVPAARRHKHKLDVVETLPSFAVYLGRLENEATAMRGGRQRTTPIVCEYWLEAADIEAAGFAFAAVFEAAVETSRQAGGFPGVKSIVMSACVMHLTPDGRGRKGSVAMQFDVISSTTIP